MKMNKTTLLLSTAALLLPSAPLLAQIAPQAGGRIG